MNYRDADALPDDEVAVLGSIILMPSIIDDIANVIDVRDFTDRRLRMAYVTMVDLKASETPISTTTLIQAMRRNGVSAEVGGVALIGAVATSVANADHAIYHAGQMRNATVVRQLQTILDEASTRAVNGDAPKDLVEYIDSRLMEFRDLGDHRGDAVVQIGDAAERLCDAIDESAEQGISHGVRTGLHCFDQVNGGFKPGTLNVIAARPSNGKSALAMQMATNMATGFDYEIRDEGNVFVARQEKMPVLFVSIEMTEEELAGRALATETEIDGRKISNHRLTELQRKRLRAAAARLKESELFLWEPPRVTISGIRAKARIFRRQNGIGCLVVDYLQLISSDRGMHTDDEAKRLGHLCRSLKALSKELEIPILLLCQLGRKAEGQVPTLDHLSDSAQIEANADSVTAIHREDRQRTDTTLHILKYRNGKTATVRAIFEQHVLRFRGESETTLANTSHRSQTKEPDDYRKGRKRDIEGEPEPLFDEFGRDVQEPQTNRAQFERGPIHDA